MTKQEKIKSAAIELFSENGFQNTSTTSITKLAGVGTGTLFTYYKNKEEMVNSIYLEVKEEMRELLENAIQDSMSCQEKLWTMWLEASCWIMGNRKSYQFTMQFSNSPYITKLTKEQGYNEFLFLFEILIKGIEAKEIVDLDVEYIITIFGSNLNATVSFLDTENEKRNEAFVKNGFDLFWRSIKDTK